MKKTAITVKNRRGLHARAATIIVKHANEFKSKIIIGKNGMEADAKSIMGILMLAAEYGTRLTITASGPDEDEAIVTMQEVFEKKVLEG